MRDIMAEVGFTPGSGPPSPEQREQMRKLMIERGLITAEEAAAAAARRASGDQPVYITRTVYRLPGGNKSATPEAVSVKVGITDGLGSEIAGGLSEGDVLLTSATIPGARPSPQPANPLSGQPPRRF
jgi:HlyD family secretion protein